MENLPIPRLSEVEGSRELIGLFGAGIAIVGIKVLGWESGFESAGLLEKATGVMFAFVAAYLFIRRVRNS